VLGALKPIWLTLEMICHRPPDSDDDSTDDMDGVDWAEQLDGEADEVENIYTQDWDIVSNSLREEMDWCCESCGIQLKFHHHLLQVHHINRDKTNNARSNLKVLCALCHSKYTDHGHIFDELGQPDREFLVAHSRRTKR
jgi:hypothetical protein